MLKNFRKNKGSSVGIIAVILCVMFVTVTSAITLYNTKITLLNGTTEVGDFHDGLAKVKDTLGWKFIDKKGNVKITLYFATEVGDFHEGLAKVKDNLNWKFIDIDGKTKITLYFATEVGDFHEGLAKVKDNLGWKFIDTDGKAQITLPVGTTEVGDFSEGLAKIKDNLGWKFISVDGELSKSSAPSDSKTNTANITSKTPNQRQLIMIDTYFTEALLISKFISGDVGTMQSITSRCSDYYFEPTESEMKDEYYNYILDMLPVMETYVEVMEIELTKISEMIVEFNVFSSSYQTEYKELVEIKDAVSTSLKKMQSFYIEITNFMDSSYLYRIGALRTAMSLTKEFAHLGNDINVMSYERLLKLHEELLK